jgi:hypothetical protein
MIKFIVLSVVAAFMTFDVSKAQVDVSLSVQIAPPELPVYSQPPCPYDGYMWAPGYWAYNNDGYYWVPGAWVYPPNPGYLWTPSYWGFAGGNYGWHSGYWGEHVGFYGGVNYGYGYGGVGFGGGRWEGNSFRYNTAVMNVNTTVIHNTYVDRTVVNTISNRTSFNGAGGITTRPTSTEQAAMHENHVMPTAEQNSHRVNAAKDRNQFASVNHGHPSKLSTSSVKSSNSTQKNNPVSVPAKRQGERSVNPSSPAAAPLNKPIEHQRATPVEQHTSQPKKQVTNPPHPHANPPQNQPKRNKKT